MTESFYCLSCDKNHFDGDKVEVRSDGYGISVTCEWHALWANRKAIKQLVDSFKREGEV